MLAVAFKKLPVVPKSFQQLMQQLVDDDFKYVLKSDFTRIAVFIKFRIYPLANHSISLNRDWIQYLCYNPLQLQFYHANPNDQ